MGESLFSPVRLQEGLYQAHDPALVFTELGIETAPQQQWRPLLDGSGRPVTQLVHGWQPLGIYRGFAPLLVLELRHGGGREASWFLDEAHRRIDDDLLRLPQATLDDVSAIAVPALQATCNALLTGSPQGRPTHLIDPSELRCLNETTIRTLIDFCIAGLAPSPVAIALDTIPPSLENIEVGGRKLSVAALRACVAPVMQQQHLGVLQGGFYEAICPFSGVMLQTRATIVDDRTNACRFVSPCGETFYLCNNPVIDERELFIPVLNCTIGRRQPELFHLFERLLARMVKHVELLPFYFDRPKRPVNVLSGFPGAHLGHYLWNDLSGLDRIRRFMPLDRTPPDRIPRVIVPDSEQGSEIFGPVDELFPEFAGRVKRIAGRDLAALVYGEGLCAVRVYDRCVSRELAGRVGRQARYDPVTGADHPLAAQFDQEGRIVILIGLRVHNRTVPAQARFWSDMIEMLSHRLGRIAIVIDGINARLQSDPTTGYGTFGPHGGGPPVLDELDIAIRLREHFRDDGVRIVNTIGAPVARSLFWAQQAVFFVAFWGAGLAKYRWVANKPGLVLTNRINLERPEGDLAIYHSDATMEAPEPLDFIAAEHVTDLADPSAPDPYNGFYNNFTVDGLAVYAAIERLIMRLSIRALP